MKGRAPHPHLALFFLRTIFFAPGRNPVPIVVALLMGMLQMEGSLNGFHAAAALLVLPFAMPRAMKLLLRSERHVADFASLLPVSMATFRLALLTAAALCALSTLTVFGCWLGVESRLPPLDQGEFVERIDANGSPVRYFRGFAKSVRGVPYPAEERVPWSLLFDGLPAAPGYPALPAIAWFLAMTALLFAAARTGLERGVGTRPGTIAIHALMAVPLTLLAIDFLAGQSWIYGTLGKLSGRFSLFTAGPVILLAVAAASLVADVLEARDAPVVKRMFPGRRRRGAPFSLFFPSLARVHMSALRAVWELDLWLLGPVFVYAFTELPLAPADVSMLIGLFLVLLAVSQLAAITVRREAGGWTFHHTLPIGSARFVIEAYLTSLVVPLGVLFVSAVAYVLLAGSTVTLGDALPRLTAGAVLLLLLRGLTGNSLILISRNALFSFGYLMLLGLILLGAHIGGEFLSYVIPVQGMGIVLIAALANIGLSIPLAKSTMD